MNLGGTIRSNRVGLESKENPIFSDLKKKLVKTYDEKKKHKGGYKRGHYEALSATNHDLVVAAVKDSKVFLEAINAVSSHKKSQIVR